MAGEQKSREDKNSMDFSMRTSTMREREEREIRQGFYKTRSGTLEVGAEGGGRIKNRLWREEEIDFVEIGRERGKRQHG